MRSRPKHGRGAVQIAGHSCCPSGQVVGQWTLARAWPLAMTLVVVILGMAYSLLWGPVVDHESLWVVPGDIWGTFFAAHYVGWGYLGGIYTAGGGLVSFPGIAVILAPCAWLASVAHLGGSFPATVPHPSAWLVLGPYEMVLSCTALFALNRLARDLDVTKQRRRVLSVVEAALLFGVTAIWGHPEDAIAIGLVTWALCAALEKRVTATGWLVGAAIVVQPLVVLMVPAIVVLFPPRQWAALAGRFALPSLVLLAAPLISNFAPTWRAITVQPNFPGIDHPTPLLAFARRLPSLAASSHVVARHVGRRFVTVTEHSRAQAIVSAGPLRSVGVVVCGVIALGVWWKRRPWLQAPTHVLWLCTMALSLRIVFEPVMDPYYLWPPLALGVVLAATKASTWIFATVIAISAGLTVVAYVHNSPWVYWSPLVLGLGIIVVAAFPRPHNTKQSTPGTEVAPSLLMAQEQRTVDVVGS